MSLILNLPNKCQITITQKIRLKSKVLCELTNKTQKTVLGFGELELILMTLKFQKNLPN